MSLFKTQTFWCTNCDNFDHFDQNSLIITKLNSDSDYIITGSHNGILRIFKPTELGEDQSFTGYKITDLLIEKICDAPILQIGCGKLVSSTTQNKLAILHPRQLAVYSLIIKEGAVDHGTQYLLKLFYEHTLRRTSANFVIGPFGGSQNRDFICVQSVDGMLSFFEQESFSFCCFLPDTLLPSPLGFVKLTDSFLTSNSNWFITSFKYKLLYEAGQNSSQNDQSGHKINCEWKYNLGEAIIDLEVMENNDLKEAHIIILGERNLYCLNHNGVLKFMKKLDYSPICFTNYLLEDNLMSLVVSETSTLLIYQNTTLKWAAHLPILPISIKRAFFKIIKGALTLLTENGTIDCCYLGTQPSLFVAPPLKNQDLDFDNAGIELVNLNKILDSNTKNIGNTSEDNVVNLNIIVNDQLEECTFETNIPNNRMCSLSVEITPQTIFDEIQLSLKVNSPLKIHPQIKFFNDLNEKIITKFYAFANEIGPIPSLNVDIIVSFISNFGVPKCVVKTVTLPLNLVVEICQPCKDNEHKITLTINQPPPSLPTLFSEFIDEDDVKLGAVAFRNKTMKNMENTKEKQEENDEKMVNRDVVTILLAKSSERYRIQSDSLPALAIIIEEIIIRLRKHFSDTNDFSISLDSPLPISDCIKYIEKHFNIRQKYNSLEDELNQTSAQFRLIQKRLISKYKAKNPTPLTNLEILLNDTFNDIMQILDNLKGEKENLFIVQNELSCVLNLLVKLIYLMDINENIKSIIASALCLNINDIAGQNWEDVIDASLCYLLRTVLAKSEKDKLRAAHTSFEEIKNVSKVEKHFSQVLERINKKDWTITENDSTTTNNNEEQISDDGANNDVPIGMELGEASTRLISARKGLLTRRQKFNQI